MSTGARGVATLGRVLARLAGGESLTAASLAAAEALPRSSVFEVVRKLDGAGLLVREPGGLLTPGPVAVRFGFAGFGLGSLQGPAEALLRLLRGDTDGTAVLRCGEIELLRFPARWDGGNEPASLDAPIADAEGLERARLRLSLRRNATRTQRGEAQHAFERVRQSLEHYLMEPDK